MIENLGLLQGLADWIPIASADWILRLQSELVMPRLFLRRSLLEQSVY